MIIDRRLPVYLLLDTSGSMAGEPIAAMEMGLSGLIEDLRNDPHALETVMLSVITFDTTAEQIVPLTDLAKFQLPELVASGTTALGAAIDLLSDRIEQEVHRQTAHQKGDWRSLVYLFTDGSPTSSWEDAFTSFRSKGLATIIACGAGPEAHDEVLKRVGDKIVRLKDSQPGTLSAFMRWVTASVTVASKTVGTSQALTDGLPALPEDQGIFLVP